MVGSCALGADTGLAVSGPELSGGRLKGRRSRLGERLGRGLGDRDPSTQQTGETLQHRRTGGRTQHIIGIASELKKAMSEYTGYCIICAAKSYIHNLYFLILIFWRTKS